MDIGQAIFDFISTPDVAYLLLVLGLFSLVIAIGTPGTGLAEAAAAICLVLSVFGLTRLPVNIAGIVLIVAGIVLFIIDLKIQSFLFAVGGAALVGIGSLLLFQPSEQTVRVSLWLIGAVTIGSFLFFSYGLRQVVRAMRIRPKTGAPTLLGSSGTLRTALTEITGFSGTAQIESELWTVRSSGPIPAGARVVVQQVDGLVLVVREG